MDVLRSEGVTSGGGFTGRCDWFDCSRYHGGRPNNLNRTAGIEMQKIKQLQKVIGHN